MSFWWCWQGFFSWRCPTEKTLKQPRNPLPRKRNPGRTCKPTQREGERAVYQTDEDSTSSGIRSDTVLLNGSDRSQTGLVQQVNPPTYLGAVIVCQGADSASVRLAIVSAVGSVTGLSTDKITVLKMK